MDQPGKRFLLNNPKIQNQIKSFWFKTFSRKSFTSLYLFFYKNKINFFTKKKNYVWFNYKLFKCLPSVNTKGC